MLLKCRTFLMRLHVKYRVGTLFKKHICRKSPDVVVVF